MPYQTRAADPERDQPAILELWEGALQGKVSREDKLRVHYLECPWGHPMVELLEHDESPVGVVAVQPREMEREGGRISAGLLMDFAVAPSHRSLGPALKLQRAALSRGAGRFDLIYGLPNDSARSLSERAGMQAIGTMTRFVRVVQHGHYLEHYMTPGLAIVLGSLVDGVVGAVRRLRNAFGASKITTWSDEPSSEFDDLWCASRTGSCVLAARDSRRLRWRFPAGLARRVRYLLVRDRKRGNLEGWFACERVEGSLRVVDYWTVDAARGTGRRLIEALAAAAASLGCVSISIELLAPEVIVQSWLIAGFVARDSRLVFGRWRDGFLSGTADGGLLLTSADEDE
jgi:GNAT superfamily N-acetyltransferase